MPTPVTFATSSHNVTLPSSGEAEALKHYLSERKKKYIYIYFFTWTEVNRHHPRHQASTTRPLPPVGKK